MAQVEEEEEAGEKALLLLLLGRCGRLCLGQQLMARLRLSGRRPPRHHRVWRCLRHIP